jgi:uncharacterized membrane protein YraQ (UPF0718 family)
VEKYILIFTSIIYEALPFIVLGVIIAGLLEEFVPQRFLARILPKNRFLAIAIGCLLGLIFPMCECGIIPIMRRLLRKGLPLSLCISYMLAGPIINVVVMMSTYVAFNFPNPNDYVFGGPMNVVFLRVGLGFITAFNVGLLIEWLSRNRYEQLLTASVYQGLAKAEQAENEGPKRLGDRVNHITATALNDFVDIMTFLILGAFLATAGRVLIERNANLEQALQHPVISILFMMGLAVLFCLCSEADAFVAANFIGPWPAAAKLAFLVLGPMMDLKLYMMYTRVFRPRLIWIIITAVAVQVFVYTLAVHYLQYVDFSWVFPWLPSNSTVK